MKKKHQRKLIAILNYHAGKLVGLHVRNEMLHKMVVELHERIEKLEGAELPKEPHKVRMN